MLSRRWTRRCVSLLALAAAFARGCDAFGTAARVSVCVGKRIPTHNSWHLCNQPRATTWAVRGDGRRRGVARGVALSMLMRRAAVAKTWSVTGLTAVVSGVKGPLITIVSPRNLLFYVVFQIVYARALRLLYRVQVNLLRVLRVEDEPRPYEESILGFLEPRLRVLSRVLAGVYIFNGVVGILITGGWNIKPELSKLVSKVAYSLYGGYFVDEAKKFVLPSWLPALRADRRKGFIYNRTTSVLTWGVVILIVLDMISQFLRIPIASTLAFGGVGGLAFGLASKDVLSNFFGGMMLLLSEPFIPGDMVTFQRNGVTCEGRVERVGWYQTRMRGRDTRPTYVPNSVFVDTMVTNMDRITHRKFETQFQLRYADLPKVTPVVQNIKAALKDIPNLDLLSPFRVHLIDFAPTGLKFNIVCFFAIKSLDEFLYLQQLALLEVARVVEELDATMTSVQHIELGDPAANGNGDRARQIGSSVVNGLAGGGTLVHQTMPQAEKVPVKDLSHGS